jgi:PilZ domain-containing protein
MSSLTLHKIKRRFPRVNLNLTAEIRTRFPDQNYDQFPVSIRSLNYGGLSFFSPVPFKVGMPVEITMYNFMDHIYFSAEITSIKNIAESATPNYKCGLKFTQLSDENRVKIHDIVNSYPANSNTEN